MNPLFNTLFSNRERGEWRFYSEAHLLHLREVSEGIELLRRYLAGRLPVLVSDAGMAAAPLCRRLADELGAPLVEVGRECDEEPLAAALERCRALGAGALVAVGGGSVLDAAKLLAAALGAGLSLRELFTHPQLPAAPLPLAAIPTTFGTGSETNRISHLAGAQGKLSIRREWLVPELALLISEIALAVPARLRLLGVVDAWCHNFEVLTLRLERSPINDVLARHALALLERHALAYVDAPNGPSAEAVATASALGGLAINNARTGLIHALAGPYAGHFHLGHAESLLPFIATGLDHLLPHVEGGCEVGTIRELVRRAGPPVIDPALDTAIDATLIAAMTERVLIDTVGVKESPIPLTRETIARLYATALAP